MKRTPKTLSVGELLDLRKNEMLAVNAEYQRGAVWSRAQKKRLIDSVLRGYPIPLFYLHYIKRSVAGMNREGFEVIDGQQRLNALHEFREGAFKLFEPVRDEAEARFPEFVKRRPCPWGGKAFDAMPPELQKASLATPLAVELVETDDPNEARDLFIRLQAGMPLNSQEKRDAWPGQFTEFVLRMGGKPEIARYPGHDFFRVVMRAKVGGDRGKFRQLAAQMAMLYFTRREVGAGRFCDTNAEAIDDYYYRHLAFDASADDARRFADVLTKLTDLLGDPKRKRVIGHEAIHLLLLVDGLWDDYTRGWEASLPKAFDLFREHLAMDKMRKDDDDAPNEFWHRYGTWTRVNSDRADSISRRHAFFVEKMLGWMSPVPKDSKRLFGSLEREVLYYKSGKKCAVCDAEVAWTEAEVHHIEGHAEGGRTTLENGALVHSACHPKGAAAKAFARKRQNTASGVSAPSAE